MGSARESRDPFRVRDARLRVMQRSLRNVAAALAAAAFLAFFEILRTQLTRVLEGQTVTLWDLVHRVVPTWISVVLISPWCAFMAQRFPFRGGHLVRTIGAHTAGGAVFVAFHLAVMTGYHVAFAGAEHLASGPQLVHIYFFYAALLLSVYSAIVLVVMLLEARREAAERAIAEARLAESLAEARLGSLQAQIRPHFLFNTLNALAVLARRGDGPAVDHAIGDLGELLRASFETEGRQEIPLGRELEFLERYVSLQRIRFPDRLEVEWRIGADTRDARVPALLVQPLVENALEHGLSTVRGGRLVVEARREGNDLVLEVRDDGSGFPPGDVSTRGIGLANTRERLALLYGLRGVLRCDNPPGGGGRVTVRLPWRTVDGTAA
jgi:signal transduction histidine kinase